MFGAIPLLKKELFNENVGNLHDVFILLFVLESRFLYHLSGVWPIFSIAVCFYFLDSTVACISQVVDFFAVGKAVRSGEIREEHLNTDVKHTVGTPACIAVSKSTNSAG